MHRTIRSMHNFFGAEKIEMEYLIALSNKMGIYGSDSAHPISLHHFSLRNDIIIWYLCYL